jgi:serine/threonine-protein kinase
VTVPNLATLSADAAQAELGNLNLMGKVTQKPSTDAQKNTVIDQKPAAGASVKPGTTVSYSVGTGPVYTKVPTDLVGKSFDQAVAELTAVKLTAVAKPVDGVQPKNTVLKLDGVTAGGSVQQGSPITLQVSNNNLFVVPPLAYLRPEDAFQQLKNAGWYGTSAAALVTSTAESTDRTVIGKIAPGVQQVSNGAGGTTAKPGQDPAAGAQVQKNARVSIVVYRAKQIVLPQFTPGVTTRDEILNALNALGDPNANVVTQNYAPDASLVGKFISITPAADATPIDFDTPVEIVVYGIVKPPPPTPTPTPTPTTKTTAPTTATTATTSSKPSTSRSTPAPVTSTTQKPPPKSTSRNP